MKPRVCILKTDGTGADIETKYAVEKAGGSGQLVHINQLRSGDKKLMDYQMLIIPGGFTYGDDVHAGKILAIELISFLQDKVMNFIAEKRLLLGIGNGFQVLVRMGLLPGNGTSGPDPNNLTSALVNNDSGQFECRWVRVRIEKTNCVFTRGLEGSIVNYPVAHQQGKFYARRDVLEQLEGDQQVVFRYCNSGGQIAGSYPDNPNGSLNAIAGICDPSGRILGLMAHPERYVESYHHPNWRRTPAKPQGLSIFKNAVTYLLEE